MGRLSIFLVILFGVSCSEPDLVLDNEFDPENPDYIEPQTSILYTTPVLNGNILNVNSVTVTWEGNDDDMEFQHSLDIEPWSEWSSVPTASFTYLDEGAHVLLVRGRYASGTEEDFPDTLAFEVNAILGSSLRIDRLYTTVTQMTQFTVDIVAEETDLVAGAGIKLEYNSMALEMIGDPVIGDFFELSGGEMLSFDTTTVSGSGIATLHLDIATYGGANSISSTGTIATLEFLAKGNIGSVYDIRFTDDTTLRDAVNDEVEIEELADGKVEIE